MAMGVYVVLVAVLSSLAGVSRLRVATGVEEVRTIRYPLATYAMKYKPVYCYVLQRITRTRLCHRCAASGYWLVCIAE